MPSAFKKTIQIYSATKHSHFAPCSKLFRSILIFGGLFIFLQAKAQPNYWQQKVAYTMQVELNTVNHQLVGNQVIVYTNNSPDTLHKVYYHLYFNAFQPGSMMDVRSRTLADPDPRIRDRISKLKPEEIGYQKILDIKQDGVSIPFKVDETIMEVSLAKPILPGATTTLAMNFESQVPVQIRRCGRNNAEGISYSMSQWYPKLCEYDYMGWHADPYVQREFYGVWGDFDVTIKIDSAFTVAGTGVLNNPLEIGHGYCKPSEKVGNNQPKLSWHFEAQNVHDFAWAADPHYTHLKYQVEDGPLLHFFYQAQDSTTKDWLRLPEATAKGMQYMNEHFGKYPYPQYSVIQAGDGGMEYAMCTFITGKRKYGSLVGVTMHEMGHSWYQMVLGTNEAYYPWMDEGFTTYSSSYAYHYVMWPKRKEDPLAKSFVDYRDFLTNGKTEPLSTHADHYVTNGAYGDASYTAGSLFLVQLRYLLGDVLFEKGMLQYFNTWKFKHPSPVDFIRIMEKTSDTELDWFLQYWVYSLKKIDYAITDVEKGKNQTTITLERKEPFPMPLKIRVSMNNGDTLQFYIPLDLLRKGTLPKSEGNWVSTAEWKWTSPEYKLSLDVAMADILKIEIDPDNQVADVNMLNNAVEISGRKFRYIEVNQAK